MHEVMASRTEQYNDKFSGLGRKKSPPDLGLTRARIPRFAGIFAGVEGEDGEGRRKADPGRISPDPGATVAIAGEEVDGATREGWRGTAGVPAS